MYCIFLTFLFHLPLSRFGGSLFTVATHIDLICICVCDYSGLGHLVWSVMVVGMQSKWILADRSPFLGTDLILYSA